MPKKAFVLLSGGLDSTTCLYKAIYDYGTPDTEVDIAKRIVLNRNSVDIAEDPIPWVEAVSIDYGQRHVKEMEYARHSCEMLGIKHTILDIGGILTGANVMLTDRNVEIPNISYADIQGVSPTYVPFRNGTMLSVLAAHAQKWVNEENRHHAHAMYERGEEVSAGIYFGAHAEDAHNWAYPDCTPEFIGAMANAIYVGTYHQVRLHTPLMSLNKKEIVELGEKLHVPFDETWSCYAGGEEHCGTCPTCRSRRQAFKDAMVFDPTVYAAS
jgi:7-cyano-7-deazaguanine synthase